MNPATALYWDKLESYLCHACSLFGMPEQLAQRLWLTRRDHKMISDFLRPLEDFVRRLIFIAALELAPMTLPPTPERKFRMRLAMPANAGAAFDPDRPETWRANFKLNPERRRLAGLDQSSANSAGAPNRAPFGRISSAPSAQRPAPRSSHPHLQQSR